MGEGIDLGYRNSPENAQKAEKVRKAFENWLYNGHMEPEGEDSHLLQGKLREGTVHVQKEKSAETAVFG